MHVGKLHAAIDLIREEFDDLVIEQKLMELQAALQDSVNSPSEQNSQVFRERYSEICKILESCYTNNVTPTQRGILDDIKASKYTGLGLLDNITKVIADNNITPANALKEIIALNKKVKDFVGSVHTLGDIFEELEIEYDDLESGEAEIGIAIPPKIIKSSLEGLKKEIHAFDRALKVFKEFKGERVESITITTISSSDFQLFLACTPVVAAAIATAIERIVAIYKNLLEIKKLREDLAKRKVPQKATRGVEDYENEIVDKELEELAKSFIDGEYKGDEGRKNELKNALKMSLRFLADRIDHGVLIEIRVAEPDKPEEGEDTEQGKKATAKGLEAYKKQKKIAENINRKGRILSQLKIGEKPIFLLSTSKPQEDKEKQAVEQEKTAQE